MAAVQAPEVKCSIFVVCVAVPAACYVISTIILFVVYPLNKKKIEIRSVTNCGGAVKAEVYVDYHTVTVCSDGEPAVAHASHSYTAAGDCVHQSLCLTFTIERR